MGLGASVTEIGQRAQMPGDAPEVHLAGVGGERAFDEAPEARPLQHHGGGQHDEGDQRNQHQRSEAGEAGEASKTSPRQWGTIVS